MRAGELRNNDRWRWLAVALALKAVVLCALLTASDRQPFGTRPFASDSGDTDTYLDPIENMLGGRGYTPDLRMPGYGAIYLPFRLLLDRDLAMGALLVLQVLISAVAAMAAARTLQRLGATRWMAVGGLVLLSLSLYPNVYDLEVLTESFTASAIVLGFHFLVKGLPSGEPRMLLLSGLFIAWAVFLRPICGVFLVVFGEAVMLRTSGSLGARLRQSAFFLLPFAVLDGAWIVRNAWVNGTIAPLSNGIYIDGDRPTPKFHVSRMLWQMGGDAVWWGEPDADIRWFNVAVVPDSAGNVWPDASGRAPSAAWTSSVCTIDSFERIRSAVLLTIDPRATVADSAGAAAGVQRLCQRCTEGFQREHPWRHRIGSRLALLWLMTVHSGSPYAFAQRFSEMPLHMKVVKLGYLALYLLVIFGGVVAACRLLIVEEAALVRALAVAYIAGLLVLPFALRLSEPRYLAPLWTPALMCVILAVSGWWQARARRHKAP